MGLCSRRYREKITFSVNHEEGLILLVLPTCAKYVSQLALSVTGVHRLVRMESKPPPAPLNLPVFRLSRVLTGILQFSVTQF